ncbi:transcriptional regulator [Nitritalea halalkaliphila LW7]|uniref:Transcriptional regulator n=1 Tax=Nitritalea halalkaliphila LW7 TaxID=1189621 RepID=I5BV14_9BACT|nr:ATP-binding protein [Nitritalea halalkaliphila]EIM73416.1 transcriptional regulator [Nitritalea halalkaliphila LW7]
MTVLLPEPDHGPLLQLLQGREGLNLDFKQRVTDLFKIARSIAGFANTQGGTLLIGVNDQRRIAGIDAEEEHYMVLKAVDTFLSPAPALEFTLYVVPEWAGEVLVAERQVLLVHIAKAPSPILTLSKQGEAVLYIREGDRTILAP